MPGVVLDSAKRVTPELNRYRVILPRHPYVPPPPQGKQRLDGTTSAYLDARLQAAPPKTAAWQVLVGGYAGVSPQLAREAVHRATLPGPRRRAPHPGTLRLNRRSGRHAVREVEMSLAVAVKAADLLYLYVETPLHAGAGPSEQGEVDLPIQREKATAYPIIRASSLKGSFRIQPPPRSPFGLRAWAAGARAGSRIRQP